MDERFIEEHNSSSSGHSEQIGDLEINQNWTHTSINIEKEEPTEEV